MVQINLPKNSKVRKGKYFKDKTGSKNLRKVNIYRWDPSSGENPRLDTYEVDIDNCSSKVLDILNKIKNEIDPTIAYRRSCAHGVCGSCAMNMDGKNGLACTKSHSEIKGDNISYKGLPIYSPAWPLTPQITFLSKSQQPDRDVYNALNSGHYHDHAQLVVVLNWIRKTIQMYKPTGYQEAFSMLCLNDRFYQLLSV